MGQRSEGAKRIYQIDPKGLWAMLSRLDQFWESALTAFAEEVERASKEENE